MSDDARAEADARLEAALESAAVRDPRPFYRARLKQLKEQDPAGYERAIDYFEETLVPAVAGDGDPVAEWLRFGRRLADLGGPGRLLELDGTGYARPAGDPAATDALLLHIPDDSKQRALVVSCPANPTPAQEASIELLVLGRQTASAYD